MIGGLLVIVPKSQDACSRGMGVFGMSAVFLSLVILRSEDSLRFNDPPLVGILKMLSKLSISRSVPLLWMPY